MVGGIELAPLITRIKVDVGGFKSDMDKAKVAGVAAAKDMSNKLSGVANVGKSMSKVGAALTKTVTLPIIAAGTASVKFAMDFEKGMAKVSTIADTSKVPIGDLKQGIIDLSNKTGQAATDLSEGLYQAISASVDTADAVSFMDVATKASVGGFTDVTTAVDGLTSVINTYGDEARGADVIANQMLVTQNRGKTTFGELAGTMSDVAPIASQLNVKTEELFSSLATTTAQGLQTSKSVTGLKAAFSNIIKPTDEAKKAAEALGIEFNVSSIETKGWGNYLAEMREKLSNASPAFAELSDKMSATSKRMLELEKAGQTSSTEYKNLKKTANEYTKELELLAEASDSDVSAMAKLFGSVEGLNAMLMLTSEQGMNMYNETMSEMSTNTTALDDAYNKMMDTPGKKMELGLTRLKNAGIKIGDALLPVVEKVADMISRLAEKIQSLSPAQIDTVVKIGAVVAAIGPLLSIGGKTIELYTKWKPVFVGISAAIAKAGGAAALFGKAIAVLSGPVGWVIGGIAALTAGGIALYKHFKQDVVPAVDLFADSAGECAVKISEETKSAVGSYMEMDDKITKTLYDMRINNTTVTEEMAQEMTGSIENMATSIQDKMEENTKKTTESVSKLFQESGGIIDAEEQSILDSMARHNEEKSKQVDFYSQQINGIYAKAADEHRSLTSEEHTQISNIQAQMRDTAITELSATEEEAAVIRQRMKDYQGRLSVEMASETIQSAVQARDGQIKSANEAYDGVVREATKLKNAGAINDEQYNTMIQKAQENRDSQITNANETYNGIVTEIQNATPGIENSVDLQNGKILTKWDQFKAKTSQIWSDFWSWLSGKWTEFSNWFGSLWGNIIGGVREWMGNIVNRVKENATSMWNAGKEIFNRLWDGIKNVWGSITGWLQGAIEDPIGTIKGIGERLWSAGWDIINRLWDGVKAMWKSVSNWFEEKAKWIGDKLTFWKSSKSEMGGGDGGSFAYNGLSYVPFDGYNATLHKGERVLTAEENRQYTQGGGNNSGGDTFYFYSPKAIDAREAARQLRRANRLRRVRAT